jgi:hypothetical protein
MVNHIETYTNNRVDVPPRGLPDGKSKLCLDATASTGTPPGMALLGFLTMPCHIVCAIGVACGTGSSSEFGRENLTLVPFSESSKYPCRKVWRSV